MRIWIGYHDRTGIVVYDPRDQVGIDGTNVCLWVVNNQELKFFQKSAVRPHLVSLEKHLLTSGLSALVQQHGIVRQVAKRYLTSHSFHASSSRSAFEESEYFDHSGALQDYEQDYEDDERQLFIEELSEDQDAWARSEEDGWFYEE
jgi:hypothetical protein